MIPDYLGLVDRTRGKGLEIALKFEESSATATFSIENKLTWVTSFFYSLSHSVTGLCPIWLW